MDFRHQATTRRLRQELRGHLYRSTKGLKPSEPQSIAWGLLQDFEEAVLMLRKCQQHLGNEVGIGLEIEVFLATRV